MTTFSEFMKTQGTEEVVARQPVESETSRFSEKDVSFLRAMKQRGVPANEALTRLKSVKQSNKQQAAPEKEVSEQGAPSSASVASTLGMNPFMKFEREKIFPVMNAIKEFVPLSSLGDFVGHMGRTALFGEKVPNSVLAGELLEAGLDAGTLGLGGKAVKEVAKKGISAAIKKAPTIKASAELGAIGAGFGVAEGLQEDGTAEDIFERAIASSAILASVPVFGKIAGAIIPMSAKQKIAEKITGRFTKAIRPSVPKKKNSKGILEIERNSNESVFAVTRNKDNLSLKDEFGEDVQGLPESLAQFSDAISQTKKQIYSEIKEKVGEAAKAGTKVRITGLADELQKIADDPVVNTFAPGLSDYAASRAGLVRTKGVFDPDQAEEAIKLLNESLRAYYQNPSKEMFGQARVDAMIANSLRKETDKAVSLITGSGVKDLKMSYGALASVEKDVANRAIVNARKNQKGLIDFTDIFSAGDVVSGLSTGNAGLIAKGVTQNAIKNFFKSINDPDKIIRDMFKDAEKLIQ